jgi:hypothetical protein
MKIKVEYTDEMIKELIMNDINDKFVRNGCTLNDIKIKVRYKQNYREKEWESGELQVNLEVEL